MHKEQQSTQKSPSETQMEILKLNKTTKVFEKRFLFQIFLLILVFR